MEVEHLGRGTNAYLVYGGVLSKESFERIKFLP